MNEKSKRWLAAAAVLVLVGAVLFAAAMTANRWDFKKLDTVEYQTASHEVNETFQSIRVETNELDVRFVFSEDEGCRVVCHEDRDHPHAVEVRDGVLRISPATDKKWYEYIEVSLEKPTVTVYLPQRTFDSITVKGSTGNVELPHGLCAESIEISTSTGDVRAEGLTARTVSISTSTGDVTMNGAQCGNAALRTDTGKTVLTDVSCDELASLGTTGDIALQSVIVKETISIERSTGDVILNDSDASAVTVKTATGNVTGHLRSEKVYSVDTSMGSVRVPQTTAGGECRITTSTGDVDFQ